MLEKPDLEDEPILACLLRDYALHAATLAFLPIGADLNTAAYRAVAQDGRAYFVKLRRGAFDEACVALPRFLAEQGIPQIIGPLPGRDGRLWADVGDFRLILYPFVEGRDGYAIDLSGRHWVDLGAALKRIHTLALPAALAASIRREDYAPHWRESVKAALERVEREVFDEPVAARLAAILKYKRDAILDLVSRAERLAQVLQASSPEFVLCHSDLHAGNVLIDARGALYIVDWDAPVFAPKERDLMYPGGGQGFRGHTPEQEQALFYRGYGPAAVDARALAYYRYERIVEDLAVECEQLLLSEAGGDDREQALRYLTSNFLPGGAIEFAYRSDQSSLAG